MDNTLPNSLSSSFASGLAAEPVPELAAALSAASVMPAWAISRSDCVTRLNGPNPPVLLDVRRAAAWEASAVCVAHALHCPPEQVTACIQRHPPQPVVVYCVFGHQVSQQACAQLRAAGWDAHFLWGGIQGGEEGADSPENCAAMRLHPLPLVSKGTASAHDWATSGPWERQP